MKNKIIQTMNGRKIELSVYAATNNILRNVLEKCHFFKNRIRIWYGDTETGRSWNEEHSILGYISNSTGQNACLILLNNARSIGGPALLDSCIIRIDDTKAKKTLYEHINFFVPLERRGLDIYCTQNEKIIASFKTIEAAESYLKFQRGEKYKI